MIQQVKVESVGVKVEIGYILFADDCTNVYQFQGI